MRNRAVKLLHTSLSVSKNSRQVPRTYTSIRLVGSLALFLLIIQTNFSFASPMNFYGIGGVGHFNKSISSMRESKFTDLVEQKHDFSCGAAAVTTILRYAYNQDIDELGVLEGLAKVSDEETVREKGFSLLDLRRYIDSLGMRGRGYEIPLEMLPRVNIPSIVLLNIRGYQHFVVFKRLIEDKVYIGDPALGNRIMTKDEFIQAWNGSIFVVIGKNFDRYTVLRQPKEGLTARKFLHSMAPVTNAELLDFGFTNADLF